MIEPSRFTAVGHGKSDSVYGIFNTRQHGLEHVKNSRVSYHQASERDLSAAGGMHTLCYSFFVYNNTFKESFSLNGEPVPFQYGERVWITVY